MGKVVSGTDLRHRRSSGWYGPSASRCPDHPDTLTTRNNLAFWRGEAGDPAGAAAASEALLADRVRVLGPDYPDT